MVFCAAGITEPEIWQYMRHVKQASSDDLLAQLDAAGLDSARFSVIQQHASPLYAIEHAVERTGSDLLVIGAR
jgi:hypothetical protein